MIAGITVTVSIYRMTEAIYPLVNDSYSISLFLRFAAETLLYALAAIVIGIIFLRIGFIKKSVSATIIASVVICCSMANIVAITSYTDVSFMTVFVIAAAVAAFVYRNLSQSIDNMEV